MAVSIESFTHLMFMKFNLIFVTSFIFICCATRKPVMYNYPQGIVEEKKAEFVQFFEKGKALYDITCARCHTTTVAGKEVIPDFTPLQLSTYDMRLGLTKHQSTLTERNISEEELELVMFFLGHKKTNAELNTKK